MIYVFENRDLKILDSFTKEAVEDLGALEKELLKLETASNNMELINNILRRIHSIKGGASFLGVSIITKLSHAIEQVIYKIKNKDIVMNSNIMDHLMKGIDLLGDFIYHMKEKVKEALLEDYRDKFEINLNDEESSKDLIIRLKEIIEEKSQNKDMMKKNCDTRDEDNLRDVDLKNSKVNKAFEKTIMMDPNNTQKEKIVKNKNSKEDSKKNLQLQSIRVNQKKLDTMMDMIAELMITKNAFMHISKKISMDYNIPELAKEVKEIGASVNRISNELQSNIMSIRMIEIKSVFQKMPRIIREISQAANKKINLITEGETTEIDKSIIEQMSDPLVHIIRNAADHGIESIEERVKKGKNQEGNIYLRAYNKNKYVYIEVEDDGKGINHEEIRQKAVDKGFIKADEAEKMSKNQLLNLIFLPGFSTAKKVTEISGRGVGMDVVKSNITKINGVVSIDSEIGNGTKITIKLPLTLVVSRGLLVEIEKEKYILPIENVVETVKISKENIYEFAGKHFAYLRGGVIGIEWLKKILMLKGVNEDLEELNAVIISNGIDKVGIIVDKLLNEQEFIVKPLTDYLSAIEGILGSTLLGNGQVVIILNPSDIMKMALG
ncbi:chemotaxis protein CheA [Clostridium sp. PL3]|uniref:histidine kinase n=1 Tax=Clostridium thailandense TaxID=2794346 RepID=A0A949TQ61_9CLOT|nr:chemotaxis protein CheA [Clostridium thailandense]MBV7273372.1 chemotaxis protein CheA [Clostridium thailandense]